MYPFIRHSLLLGLLFLSFCPTDVLAVGGIRGTIRNAKNEPLAFASIVVKSTAIGTMSNAEAKYELALAPGTYEIIFQYLGYQTLTKSVEIGTGFLQFDAVLLEQIIALQEVQVKAGKEDPAYTIMRKAIAKSKFHLLQVQKYTARLYTRGGGRLTSSPFFLRGKLKKEGIDPNTVYFTESVADISFQQPNTFRQKVLSIRSNMDKLAPPNDYLNASFYEPMIAGAVSPLSPRAFAYYKFQYLGIFKDRGFEVNKIQVIARSKGDNVFEGYIYIIEDRWSLHSLDLNTMKSGFRFNIKQLLSPIQQVWMPVSNQIFVKGSFLGFEGEFKYMASVSNYALQVNPAFKEDIELIDEKVEKPTPAPVIASAASKKKAKDMTLEEALSEKKELKRKDLNKLIRKYEKQELQKQKNSPQEANVVSNDSTTIDSLAYRRDTTFWSQVRTVPLTKIEVESFTRRDSVMKVEEAKAKKDTLKKNTNKFKPEHLLFGHKYGSGKATEFDYRSPLFSLNFNTVEGFAFNTSLLVTHTFPNKRSVYVRPLVRYAFARRKLTGTLRMGYRGTGTSLFVEGGQYISQFNPDNPIPPIINTIGSLFFESNYMKIYEKKFVAFNYQRKLSDGLSFKGNVEWADRSELFNQTNFTFIRYRDHDYTPNAPENTERDQEIIAQPRALTLNLNLNYQPWVKHIIRNGKKRMIHNDSPLLGFNYRKGVASMLGSQVDYDRIELSFRHGFDVGVRGRLYYSMTAGAFVNNNKLSLPDYQHFMGNQTILQTGNMLTSFRLLDYYPYSTAHNYFHAHALYQFRKFLFTQIPLVRLTGAKEIVFANYLTTSRSNQYWEVGYGLDGILRLFRLEAVAAFQGNQYQRFGFRIGLTLSGLKVQFSEGND
ncbi:MAG: DUF5686 and carboxypeptidase regulatory-like domain-containing protein [Bacteroidota bacterium]